MQECEREINLIDLFKELKQKVVLIVFVGITLAGIIYIYSSFSYEETYIATSTIYIETNEVEGNVLVNAENVPVDYTELIKSKTVLEGVIEETGIAVGYEQLLGMLSISNPEKTHVLNISVSNKNPEMAALLSNTISNVAIEHLNEVSDVYKLKIIGKASVPQSPVRDNNLKDIIAAFIIGICVSSAIIIFRFVLRDGIMDRDDAELYLHTKLLADYTNKRKNNYRPPENTFKYLCSNLNHVAGEFKCILVTSTLYDEGNENIAEGITKTLNALGNKVAFIDMDGGEMENLNDELLRLKSEYDVVIINASAVEKTPNIADVIEFCDGAVLVVRKNFVNRKLIKHAKEQLELMKCNIIGIVLTDKEIKSRKY